MFINSKYSHIMTNLLSNRGHFLCKKKVWRPQDHFLGFFFFLFFFFNLYLFKYSIFHSTSFYKNDFYVKIKKSFFFVKFFFYFVRGVVFVKKKKNPKSMKIFLVFTDVYTTIMKPYPASYHKNCKSYEQNTKIVFCSLKNYKNYYV